MKAYKIGDAILHKDQVPSRIMAAGKKGDTAAVEKIRAGIRLRVEPLGYVKGGDEEDVIITIDTAHGFVGNAMTTVKGLQGYRVLEQGLSGQGMAGRHTNRVTMTMLLSPGAVVAMSAADAPYLHVITYDGEDLKTFNLYDTEALRAHLKVNPADDPQAFLMMSSALGAQVLEFFEDVLGRTLEMTQDALELAARRAYAEAVGDPHFTAVMAVRGTARAQHDEARKMLKNPKGMHGQYMGDVYNALQGLLYKL